MEKSQLNQMDRIEMLPQVRIPKNFVAIRD
jgi:hypothetical protein